MNKQFRLVPEGFDTAKIKAALGFSHTDACVGEEIESAVAYKSKKDVTNFVTQLKTTNHSLALSAEQWKGSGLPEDLDAGEWKVTGVNPLTCERTTLGKPVTRPTFIADAKWNAMSDEDKAKWSVATKEEYDAR